ncbi:bifunctional DNA primase/polymerase (plasmid) [Kitasatospora purpeofusca]|uniref:bifunctional DNA primase/polymerase n=1 Tax=Kitasatospora purpeofusca TaxID=67352 RepID=UPI002E144611|nr:bifunctional DNA primase/polymerase [Kitasatospora purpeofusca]
MTAPNAATSSDRTGAEPRSLAVARWCAAQGWPVHPLAPGRKTPPANCEPCRNAGHDPATCPCLPAGRWCHGFHAATLDQDLLAAWWRATPGFGTAVSCGPAGLVVIDVDTHSETVPDRDRILPGIPIDDDVPLEGLSSGYHSLALLAALRSAPAPAADTGTLRVRTPSGGLHIWYRDTAGLAFTCSTGSSANRALAWQVDVRAHGGFIVAPGTVTADGTYEALPGARTPAPLPQWLSDDLARTGHLKTPSPQPALDQVVPPRARQAVIAAGGGRTSATRMLDSLLQDVADCASAPEGTGFTAKLNRAAYTAGGLAAGGHLTEREAEQALLDAALAARPAQDRHNRAVIRAGLAAGARRPLHLEVRG